MTGPVSLTLEQEILGEIRRQGIVVWLDKDASYTQFVDDLAARHAKGELPFPVVGFRGSFLDAALRARAVRERARQSAAAHPHAGLQRGVDSQDARYSSSTSQAFGFRKSLDTLIREAATSRVTPAEVDGVRGEAAEPGGGRRVAHYRRLAEHLRSRRRARRVRPRDAGGGSRTAGEPARSPRHGGGGGRDAPGVPPQTHGHGRRLGSSSSASGRSASRSTGCCDALAAWILCVEYVHDLRRPAHRPDAASDCGLSRPSWSRLAAIWWPRSDAAG